MTTNEDREALTIRDDCCSPFKGGRCIPEIGLHDRSPKTVECVRDSIADRDARIAKEAVDAFKEDNRNPHTVMLRIAKEARVAALREALDLVMIHGEANDPRGGGFVYSTRQAVAAKRAIEALIKKEEN